MNYFLSACSLRDISQALRITPGKASELLTICETARPDFDEMTLGQFKDWVEDYYGN
jgi:hypothetical protein